MSEHDDPPRLFEAGSGAPAALGELFRSARADLPSLKELGLLSTRLDATLGRGAEPASPVTRLGPKLALGIGAALVGLGVGVWLLASKPEIAPTAPVSPQDNGAAANTAPIETAISGAAKTPLDAPPPVTNEAPSAASTGAPGAAPSDAPSTARSPTTRAARGPSEAALLESARAALGKSPSRALAFTREHARRFPQGILAQEREVIAIEALRRSGEERAARERAGEFQREYPQSPHRRTIDPKNR